MYKVGELLVRFGKILQVAEVKIDCLVLRPFFNSKSSHDLTYSIPNQNLKSGRLRRLVTKKQLELLFTNIFKKTSTAKEINVTESKVSLSSNDLADSLQLIKTLWLEKQTHAGFLPGGRLSLYQQALNQVSEEIAAVKGTLPDEAKLLVLTSLTKGQKLPTAVN
jgi:RNA polymerase-interacting CarD/CdnL/TRCF family regulator